MLTFFDETGSVGFKVNSEMTSQVIKTFSPTEILRHYVDEADGAGHLGPGVQSSLGIGPETNADFLGSLLSKRSSLGQAFGRHAVRRSGDAQRG
jgi:hypothetical protein